MMNKYKVLYTDLDGILITTASNKTFPEGIWDMKLRFDVLDAIKKLSPRFVCIVTNQGGIASGYSSGQPIDIKVLYIQVCIQEYCGTTVRYAYCSSMNEQDPRRKPNPGMLEELLSGSITGQPLAEKEECLMIGDASDKPGQWSDTDKRTAENFGIDYLDVEDFVKEMSNERTGRIYKEIKKSWFKKPKIEYTYTISTPLIEDPFYDGEYGTNRVLKAYSIRAKQHLINKIQEFKENEGNDSSRASEEKESFGGKTKFVYP